jgi:hypothetical protein
VKTIRFGYRHSSWRTNLQSSIPLLIVEGKSGGEKRKEKKKLKRKEQSDPK